MDPPQIQGAPAVPKMGVRARVSNWSKKQPSISCGPSDELLEDHQPSGSQSRLQVSDLLSPSSTRSFAAMKRSNSEVTLSDFGSEDLAAITSPPGAALDRRSSSSSLDWLSSSGLWEQEPSAPPGAPGAPGPPLSASLQAAAQIAQGDISVLASADGGDELLRTKAETSVLGRLRPLRSHRKEEQQQEGPPALTAHRCFSHHDVQSVLSTFGGLLSSPEAPPCLQFLDEMEAGMESVLDLTGPCCPSSSSTAATFCSKAAPRSCTNAAVSVLESCTETQLSPEDLVGTYDVEHVDLGAKYYHKYFYNKDHHNFFGIDPKFGPVALSIRREALDGGRNQTQFIYRIILRTGQRSTLRGSIMEDSVPSSSKHGTSHGLPLKDVLEFVLPDLHLQSLRVASSSPRVADLLLQLDQQELVLQHTVGLLLCPAPQTTGHLRSPALNQFLNMLSPVGPMKYQDQQSPSGDSTSTQSFYTTFRDFQLMIHVSTLPSTAAEDTAQMLKARLIGNDVVTVIFQEPDAPAFNLQTIVSHFPCVFIIIRVHRPCTQHTCYSVEVFRCRGIPSFGPPIPAGWTFPASASFRDFLLTKIVNAKHAACRVQSSTATAARARQEQLTQLVDTWATPTPLDVSNAKFSFISLGAKKKERVAPQPQAYLQSPGALTWSVTVRDPSSSAAVACRLALSAERVVLMEEAGRKVVFNCSCRDVIGWSAAHGSIKLFYQHGLRVTFSTRGGSWQDSQEITHRLQLVTRGAAAADVTLRRNRLGQLGFHVNVEGVVAEVEAHGSAWQAGLRPGCRLVEICSVATAALSHTQIIELLRTSATVAAVILPPHRDGTPRRGFSDTHRPPLLEAQPSSDVTSCPRGLAPPTRLPSAPPATAPPSHQSPSRRSWSSDSQEGSRARPDWLISSEAQQEPTRRPGTVKGTKPASPPRRRAELQASADGSSLQETLAARSCWSCSNTLSSDSSDGRTSARRLAGLRGLSVDSGIDSATSAATTAVAGATLVLADVWGKETARPTRRLRAVTGTRDACGSRHYSQGKMKVRRHVDSPEAFVACAGDSGLDPEPIYSQHTCLWEAGLNLSSFLEKSRPSYHPIRDGCVRQGSTSRCSSFSASSPQKHLILSKSLDSLSLASCGRIVQMPVLQRPHSMLLQISSSQPHNGGCSPSSLSDNQQVISRSSALDSDITAALSGKVSHLEEIVHQLQLALLQEQQEKAALQQQVLNLGQDNLRLRESVRDAEHVRRFGAPRSRRRSFP